MPIVEGWGTGPWGPMPWGGVVLPDDTVPGWGAGSRYERVRREREYREREQQEILNVLFKIDGLRATGHLGKVQVTAGTGLVIRPQPLRSHSAVGVPQIQVGITALAPSLYGISRLGEVEVQLVVMVAGILGKSAVGKPRITAQRNLTDEELIHMLAEML